MPTPEAIPVDGRKFAVGLLEFVSMLIDRATQSTGPLPEVQAITEQLFRAVAYGSDKILPVQLRSDDNWAETDETLIELRKQVEMRLSELAAWKGD